MVVGLAIFAATAAPGRIFERRVEQRAVRPPRSTVAEVVELVVVGQMATLAAALCVLALGQGFAEIGFTALELDVGALVAGPGDYAEDEPGRIIGAALLTLVLSYAFADLAARLLYPASADAGAGGFKPFSVWYELFWLERNEDDRVIVTVELDNGFRVSGTLGHFTADTDAENREVGLRAPILFRPPGGEAVRYEGGDFVLLRENDIRFIAGRFRSPNG